MIDFSYIYCIRIEVLFKKTNKLVLFWNFVFSLSFESKNRTNDLLFKLVKLFEFSIISFLFEK